MYWKQASERRREAIDQYPNAIVFTQTVHRIMIFPCDIFCHLIFEERARVAERERHMQLVRGQAHIRNDHCEQAIIIRHDGMALHKQLPFSRRAHTDSLISCVCVYVFMK